MTLHDLIDQSYQAVLAQLSNTHLILLHPHSRYRSIIIAKLVNDPDLATFYYAMGPDDVNLQGFLTSITQCLANQHPTFGRHINALPQDVYEAPEEHFTITLETFVKDLSEVETNDFVLILDEYDRSDRSDDVQRFVEKLSGHLPSNCHLILNGRTLPRLPWISMIAQKRAIMLKDEQIILDGFYGQGNSSKEGSTLEVFALGEGKVLYENNAVNSWEGHLPRLLFFFALDRPIVTRSEICQAFWPNLSPEQAVNVFHVTKRRLHKALDMDVLVHQDGYYRVNPGMKIYHDVAEFVNMLMEARVEQDIDKRMEAWQRAAELYQGDFLQGHNDSWIQGRRLEFRDGYLEVLIEMAHAWMEKGDDEQALNLFKQALEEDDGHESIHQLVLRLYSKLGRRGDAAAHYQKFLQDLNEEGLQPSLEITELYNEIMA